MYFQQLPEIVNRYLAPPEPIVLHYTLNPAVAPPEKPAAWDVEVKVDDSNLKGRMQHVVMSMAQDSAKELTKLDEEASSLFLFCPLHCYSTQTPFRSDCATCAVPE